MPVIQPGVWGIDLGQCGLKAIRLELVDGEVTATAFDYVEHPKILSQPDADPDQLTREALDKFLSRNSLRGDTVVISVPGQSGLARFVKLPPVEEKKISDIVRFEAKQQIPFPLDEVVWDFQKLSAGVVTDGFALETEIGLFAMKRDMVNRYMQHFTDVNVEVHVVQMAPLALCNFVSHDLLGRDAVGDAGKDDDEEEAGGKKQCVVALDIGTDNSNLVITDAEKIIWQRPIPLGGNHFTRALTKDLKLTFAKAEHLKRNAVKSPDLKKILAALRPVLNDFVSEVQRSLGYFTNTHRDAHIKYMVGLGNAFRLPGLQKFLQEKLQLEVRKLAEFKRLQGEDVTAAPQFTENILSFAVAHGLALQGLKRTRLQTNLLPQEIRFDRFIQAKKPWAVAAAALLWLAVLGLAFGRARQLAAWTDSRNASALAEGKKEAERNAGFVRQTGELKKAAADSREAVRRIEGGADERFNWNTLYQYINDCVPRPDGGRLPRKTGTFAVRSKEKYLDEELPDADRRKFVKTGKQALDKLLTRRGASPDGVVDPNDAAIEDEIKTALVHLNIEGVISLYADDFTGFYKKLKDDKNSMLGLRNEERAKFEKGPDGLPKSGWLVEIRGYTYHVDAEKFVENTLVENLANPKAAEIPLSVGEQAQVKKHLHFVFLYKKVKDDSPSSGAFQAIGHSYLREALASGGAAAGPGKQGDAPVGMPGKGMPGGGKGGTPEAPAEGEAKQPGVNRDNWQPLGEIAVASLGGGASGGDTKQPPGIRKGGSSNPPPKVLGGQPGRNPAPGSGDAGAGGNAPSSRVPRTEFVIFLIWSEPLPPDGTSETPTPGPNPNP